MAKAFWGLAGAALLVALAASGRAAEPQTSAAPSTTVDGLTVTAEKPNPLVDRTTEFVRQRLPVSRFEQYARFRDPVCVNVIGLPAQYSAFIAKRIIEVAHEVKAPVSTTATCKPNVNVIFSTQPQAQLTDIAKRREILFGYYFKTEAKQISTFRPPIEPFYLTRSVGTDGRSALELNGAPLCIGTGQPGTFPCDLAAPAVTGKAGSRLGTDMSSELVHSLILADAERVSGEKIGAVADYIAVLALSRWRGLERCSGVSTILNLMADECDAEDKSQEATVSDLAILTGLYSADPREAGQQQRAAIASAVRKAVAGADEKR